MKAVILVGGRGTRLEPLTSTTPKPMLPLVNIPFLEYQLGLLAGFGVTDIIISTGYLPEAFAQVERDSERLGVRVKCVTEDKPLGTCGAVKHVAELLDDTFLVFNGDILTNLNLDHLIEYHRAKKSAATIALTPVEDPTAYGLVPLENGGRIKAFLEKPSWDEVTTDLINAGTYVLEPRLLEQVPAGENYSFERGLFPSLLEKGEPMYGFPSGAYWLDIGTPEKYLLAHHDVLDGNLNLEMPGEQIKNRVWADSECRIDESATVFGPAVIGSRCRVDAEATIYAHTTLGADCVVERGARLEGCVLFDGCVVGEGSVVRNSVLGKGVRVGKRVHVEEAAVLGEGLVIGDENQLRKGIRVWPGAELGDGKIRF